MDDWRRPLRRPCITWLKTIQQELKSNNLSPNEAIDMAQNQTLRVVHDKKKILITHV